MIYIYSETNFITKNYTMYKHTHIHSKNYKTRIHVYYKEIFRMKVNQFSEVDRAWKYLFVIIIHT